MDAQTFVIIIAVSALILIAGFLIVLRSQARASIDCRVEATITHIQVESSTLGSWWVVTAEWSDQQTSRVLTFRSHHLKFPPHHRIGERIVVKFDATKPKHYRMEL